MIFLPPIDISSLHLWTAAMEAGEDVAAAAVAADDASDRAGEGSGEESPDAPVLQSPAPKKRRYEKRFLGLPARTTRRSDETDVRAEERKLAKEVAKAKAATPEGKHGIRELNGLTRLGGLGGRFRKKRMELMTWKFFKTRAPDWTYEGEDAEARLEANMASIQIMADASNEDVEDNEDEDDNDDDEQAHLGKAIISLDDLNDCLSGLSCEECLRKREKATAAAYQARDRAVIAAYQKYMEKEGSTPEDFFEQYTSLPPPQLPPPTFDIVPTHLGIATTIGFVCGDCSTVASTLQPRSAKKFEGKPKEGSQTARSHPRLAWKEDNIKMVIACLMLGGGPTEAEKIIGLFDLPRPTSFKKYAFATIEEEIGKYLRSVTKESMDAALQEEIKATLEAELEEWEESGMEGPRPMEYAEYKRKLLTNTLQPHEYPRLTVCYDMGWQKRGSGRQYNSLSGHAFMIGGYTGKIISGVVVGKICGKCKSAEKQGVEADPHECPGQYEGSSKGMEADSALVLTKDAWDNRKFCVKNIVADDDSTMRAVLSHSYRALRQADVNFEWPLTESGNKKRDTGRLPLSIPEPNWLADPTHRQKVFASKFFAAANPPSLAKPVQKADAIRLKKYFGYWVKQNRDKSLEEMKKKRHAPLYHLFDDHSQCGDWCPRKANPTAPVPQGQYYRSKTAHAKSFAVMKELYEPFFTDEKLEEMRHTFETQVNESLNVAIMMLAPKHKTYSKSMSLQNRVMIGAGVKNCGFGGYWAAVFDQLGIEVTSSTAVFFEQVSSDRQMLKKREASIEFKRERARRNSKAQVNEQKKVERDMARGSGYGKEAQQQLEKGIPTPSSSPDEIKAYCTSVANIQNLIASWKSIDPSLVSGVSNNGRKEDKVVFLLDRAEEYRVLCKQKYISSVENGGGDTLPQNGDAGAQDTQEPGELTCSIGFILFD